MEAAIVTTRGRVTIPKAVRRSLHVKAGTRIRFRVQDGEIVLTPWTRRYFQQMAGMLGTGGRATRALLREHSDSRWRGE